MLFCSHGPARHALASAKAGGPFGNSQCSLTGHRPVATVPNQIGCDEMSARYKGGCKIAQPVLATRGCSSD